MIIMETMEFKSKKEQQEYQQEWYKENKDYFKDYYKSNRIKRRFLLRECMLNLKINGCAICGYNININALSFHHVNPEDKKFNLSINSMNYKASKIIQEINKCILLCANCHREIHSLEQDIYYKICSRCKEKKLFTEFHRSKPSVDGRTTICKLCRKLEYDNKHNHKKE